MAPDRLFRDAIAAAVREFRDAIAAAVREFRDAHYAADEPEPITDVCPTCEGDGCDPLSWEDTGTGEPPAPTAGCPTCGTPGRRGSGRCDPVPVRGHHDGGSR